MNALSHGLLARTTLMRGEWSEGLKNIFNQYVDRLAPADTVEYGYVEEMVAACWRLRRLWAIETRTLDNEADAQAAGDPLDRLAAAFAQLAEKPHPDLLHRYEMRMHLTYQRALHNLLLLRTAGKNEPSPISGHSAPQPTVAPEPPAGPAPPSSPEGGRASAGAGLEPGSGRRPESSRAANILANCCSQQSEVATEPVEQAVLPSTPAVVPADGGCEVQHPEIPNEPSPISGHLDPEPVVAPSPSDAPLPGPPVLPSRARQQAVVSSAASPPLAPSPGRNVGRPLEHRRIPGCLNHRLMHREIALSMRAGTLAAGMHGYQLLLTYNCHRQEVPRVITVSHHFVDCSIGRPPELRQRTRRLTQNENSGVPLK